jgi:hypothetical protein
MPNPQVVAAIHQAPERPPAKRIRSRFSALFKNLPSWSADECAAGDRPNFTTHKMNGSPKILREITFATASTIKMAEPDALLR